MSGGSGSWPPSAAASAASGRAPSPNGAPHPRPGSGGSEAEHWSGAGGGGALPALRAGRRRVASLDPFPRWAVRCEGGCSSCRLLCFEDAASYPPLRCSCATAPLCRDAHAEGLLLGSPHDSAAGRDPAQQDRPLDSPQRGGPSSWHACLMQASGWPARAPRLCQPWMLRLPLGRRQRL